MNLTNRRKFFNQYLKESKNGFVFKLFSFFKKKKGLGINENLDAYDSLDKKLVYSLSPHKTPSLRQIKYVKKVLSNNEKIIIYTSLFIVFLALIFLAVNFYRKNLEIVPAYGGEYSEAILGSPKNINPLYDIARDADKDISRLIFSSLFKRDSNGLLTKDLVKDYSVSEDAKEYTFEIIQGVLWHHGENLTVDDIVFTFSAIKNQEYGSPLRNSFVGVEIEKIDDFNFKFVLSEPYAAFLDLLVFGIIPQNLWMNIDPKNAPLAELNLEPIGSGPYKFKSLTKNKLGEIKEMSFVANEDYYDKVPYISNINFKFFSYFSELTGALNNNLVDGISYLPHSSKDDLISQNSLNFHQLNLPQIASLFFNQKSSSFLEDKNIRKALALSIDKKALINDIFSGNAGLAYGPILPNSFAYNSEIEKYDYNIEEAKRLLDESKWLEAEMTEDDLAKIRNLIYLENNKVEKIELNTEQEASDVVEIEDNSQAVLDYDQKLSEASESVKELENWELKKKIISDLDKDNYELSGKWRYKISSDKEKKYDYLFVKLTTVDLSDNIDVANFIKISWESVGVKTSIKIINAGQIQTEIIKNKSFEILLLSQVVGNDPDSYLFWHSSQSGENGLNITSYRNRDADKLLEEARMTLNLDERIEKYKKFQEILNNDLPAIFLYFPTYTYVQIKEIKGFDVLGISDPADRFNNISNWYIKIKRKVNF